jgi:hypothetical protein
MSHKINRQTRRELGPVFWVVIGALVTIACLILAALWAAGCRIPPAMIAAMVLAGVCIVPSMVVDVEKIMKKPWYVGTGRAKVKPTKGVSDWDGTADIYARDPLPKIGVQYGMGETFILASIRAIRQQYPDKCDQLAKFQELKALAEGAHLSGRDRDAIADIRLAIDEVKIDLR